jgi:hypothetical protein
VDASVQQPSGWGITIYGGGVDDELVIKNSVFEGAPLSTQAALLMCSGCPWLTIDNVQMTGLVMPGSEQGTEVLAASTTIHVTGAQRLLVKLLNCSDIVVLDQHAQSAGVAIDVGGDAVSIQVTESSFRYISGPPQHGPLLVTGSSYTPALGTVPDIQITLTDTNCFKSNAVNGGCLSISRFIAFAPTVTLIMDGSARVTGGLVTNGGGVVSAHKLQRLHSSCACPG